MSNRIRAYVGSFVVLAAATFFWVYDVSPDLNRTATRGALWFAALAAISGLAAYKKGARRETGSIAFLPMLASVIVVPSWITVVCLGVSILIVEVASRRVFIKAVFNVAQAMFWVACAILAYHYLGGRPLASGTSVNYVAFAATLASFAFLHSGALAGAISIS